RRSFRRTWPPPASGKLKSGARSPAFSALCAMPEAASSISAQTMASGVSGGTCAMNSERKASSSALSDIVFSSLDLGHAAIDVELDSSNVTRLVRCEEGNSFGDLIRISQPAQRNVLRKVVFHLRQRVALLPGVEIWRVNMSRANVVERVSACLP